MRIGDSQSIETSLNISAEEGAQEPTEEQVSQVGQQVARPEIDEFYAAIRRDKRNRGFFAAFSFADTARKECERLWLEEQVNIQLVTVQQLIVRDFR